MARRTLLRNKAFQEIIGNDDAIPYRYVQDGRYFDDAGNEIDKQGNAVNVAKIEDDKPVKASEADIEAEVQKRVAAKLAEAGNGKAPGDVLAGIKEEGDKGKKK